MKVSKIPYSEFIKIYSKVPRLSVELVVRENEGIVLSKRSIEPFIGWWHLPGGTVLYGETLKETVKRVAKEELGIGVKIEKMLGYIEYPEEEKVRGFGWTIGIAFLCRRTKGKITGSKQGLEVKVFRKVLPYKTLKEQKDFINKVKLL